MHKSASRGYCYSYLSQIISVFRPLSGISFDVLPDLPVIVFIADDMLIVGALPDDQIRIERMNLLTAAHFQKSYRFAEQRMPVL